jgi:hypothetical protein
MPFAVRNITDMKRKKGKLETAKRESMRGKLDAKL